MYLTVYICICIHMWVSQVMEDPQSSPWLNRFTSTKSWSTHSWMIRGDDPELPHILYVCTDNKMEAVL